MKTFDSIPSVGPFDIQASAIQSKHIMPGAINASGLQAGVGMLMPYTSVDNSIADGDAVYVNTSGKIARAQANASGTMPAIGITMGAIASGQQGNVMVQGLYSGVNMSGLQVGQSVFVSPVQAGKLIIHQPTLSGQIVQRMGYAHNASTIYIIRGDQFQVGGTAGVQI